MEELIKTLLAADSTLGAIATGGVYTITETGRTGLNRTKHPDAFVNGVMKPTVLIKERATTEYEGIADEAAKYKSVRCVIEIWLYENDGYTNINQMRDRIFTLLHQTNLSGGGRLSWLFEIRQEYDNILMASVERVDYSCIYIKKG